MRKLFALLFLGVLNVQVAFAANPTLTLRKVVQNNAAGTAEANDWTLSATGPNGLGGFVANPVGSPTDASTAATSVAPGTYFLGETGPGGEYLPGYSAQIDLPSFSFWACTGGGVQDRNRITLAADENVTCTVTNVDTPDPDLPGVLANLETIPSGSLIIPMDTALQTISGPQDFNLTAYGLVNKLLQNNIPVKWAIRSDKIKILGSATAPVGPNTTATHLTDATKNFITLGVLVGDLVTNVTDGYTRSRVTAVAATALTVVAVGGDIVDFDATDAYVIDGRDFTATAERIRPSAVAAASVAFAGGPFIVSNEIPFFVDKAIEIILGTDDGIAPDLTGVWPLPDLNGDSALEEAQEAVRVYRTTADTLNVDVRYDLTHKPFIAVSDINTIIHAAVLVEAGIPGATLSGNAKNPTITNCSPLPGEQDFDPNACNWVEINPVTLASLECATVHLEPHRDTQADGFTIDDIGDAVENFVTGGGNMVVQCHGVEYFENHNQVIPNDVDEVQGVYMTTLGTVNEDENGVLEFPHPELAFYQITGPLDGDLGGSVPDWSIPAGGSYKNNGYIGAHHLGANSDVHQSASAKAPTGGGLGGNVFYLGGHTYAGNELDLINGRRMLLNALFVPPDRGQECGLTINGSLILVKEVVNDGGGTGVVDDFGIATDAGDPVWDAGVTVGDTTTYTAEALTVIAGLAYSLSEDDVTNYDEGTWTCTDGDGDDTGGGAFDSGSVTLEPGQTKTCTITNDDSQGNLIIVKRVVNGNGGTADVDDFNVTTSAGALSFGAGAPDGTNTLAYTAQTLVVLPNTAYTLIEDDVTGYGEGTWDCEGGDDAGGGPFDGGSVTLAPGDTKTCTITNDDSAPQLTLRKVVVNENGGTNEATEWTLTATGTGGFSGTPTGGALDASLGPNAVNAGVTYTLSESGPAGYSPSAWSCDGGNQNDDEITLALGDNVTCSIGNDDIAPTLTLRKVVTNDDGGENEATEWTLTATGTGGFSGTPSGGALDASLGPNDVNAGVTYTLSESGPAGYSPSAWSCDGGNQNDDEITLALDDDVTCTITNDDVTPTVILRKRVINDDGGSAVVGDFNLSTSAGALNFDAGVVDGTNILLYTADPIPVTAGVQYTLAEIDFPNYNEGNWTCVGGNGLGGGLFSGGVVTLALGVTKTCTITNNDGLAGINLAKTVFSVTENPSGTFTVVYRVFATNNGDAQGTYDIVDTFTPGAGVTLQGGTATIVQDSGPGTGGTVNTPFASGATAVDDQSLGAGETDVWSVTAVFVVDPAVATLAELDCLDSSDPATSTGTANGVTGGALDEDLSDNRACAPLPQINLAKTVFSVTENPAGTFTVVYSVTASNNGEATGTYDIDDMFTPGTGVTLSGNPTIVYNSGPGSSGTVTTPFANGGKPVDNAVLAAGQTETWRVTAVFVVDPATATVDSLDCEDFATPATNTGTANGVLGSGTDIDLTDNRACAPLPQINLAKSVFSVTENPSGTFTVVYNVTATNNGDAAGTYDVDDTFTPGTGVTLQGGTATIAYFSGPGQNVAVTSPFASGGKPVDNQSIGAGLTDTWRVTAVFVVNPATATVDSLDCDDFATPATNTGTANGVLGSSTDTDLTDNRACAPLPQINLAKSVFSATQGPAGTWTVVYNVTAVNSGDGNGVYNIQDTFTPGTGVTLQGGTATIALTTDGGGTTGTLTSPFTNGLTPVQNRTLASGQTDVWTVTAVFVVNPATATADSLDCAEYVDPAISTGTANGVLGSGTDTDPTDNRACEPLPQINLAKSVFSVTEGPPGTFTVVYSVTATNDGGASATYDIDDTFTPGTGVTLQGGTATIAYFSGPGQSGTVTSPFTNGGKPVDEAVLASGATDTWRVTAVFVVDPATATVDSLDCDNFANPATSTGTANGVLGSSSDSDLTDNRACAPLPQINLAKTVQSTTDLGNNNWRVVYRVTATNNGDGNGQYDLVDTFSPGNGITLVTAQLTSYNAGSENSQTGTIVIGTPLPQPFASGATLVTGEPLAAGLNESWTITADFEVLPDETDETLECSNVRNGENSGFHNFVEGSSTDLNESDNHACSQPELPAERTTFRVIKDFTDDSPEHVEVEISCFTGLPLIQNQEIWEGRDVVFIVESFDPGELDCDISEVIPEGYSPTYDGSIIEGEADEPTEDELGCHFENVEFGEFLCSIVNTPDPVDVVIEKLWVIEGSGGDAVDTRYKLKLYCDAEIVDGTTYCGHHYNDAPTAYDGSETWCKTFYGDGSETFTAQVIPEYPDSECWVEETVYDDAVEIDNECGNENRFLVSAGHGNSCLITNTVFFEGIPTLSQYGMAILALLMLGVGLVGFRRFV